jgi:hypothetical protein
MSNDTGSGGLSGQSENPLDWSAGLPDSDWLRIRPGGVVAMTIVGRELRPSNLREGEQELVANVLVDGVAFKWSPNIGALRELGSVGVRDGDHIRVTRGDDVRTKGGRTLSTWIIERLDQPRSQVDAEMDERVAQGERKEGDDESLPF